MTPLTFSNIPKRYVLTHPKSLKHLGAIKAVFPYTMIRFTGIYQMHEIVEKVVQKNINGAFVEMGCWNGGCGAYIAHVSKENGSPRTTWLFDSFEGLPEATPEDGSSIKRLNMPVRSGTERQSFGFLKAEPEKVAEVSQLLSVSEQVKIVPGWFQDSVPTVKEKIGPIAILRLDGDMYESTIYCLNELYDAVSPGGYIVIDDYKNWPGCRQALYEFFVARKIYPFIHGEAGVSPVYFIKESNQQ